MIRLLNQQEIFLYLFFFYKYYTGNICGFIIHNSFNHYKYAFCCHNFCNSI